MTQAAIAAPLVENLRRAGVTDVLTDAAHRSAYASDASLYRIVPQAIVRPRSAEDVLATLQVCRTLGVPITARGAGTSVAGNAIGPGVVLDFSRHMNRVLDIDPVARTARVQAGTIQATLQAAAKPHGLRFGPDPSTHTRCTIGGMIGNNSCGSRTLGYGRTSDNVAGLRAYTIDGDELITDPLSGAEKITEALRGVIGDNLAVARTEFARFGRQVSGYAVEHLLPENGFNLTEFLVGSEGTLAVITEATVKLVADPVHRTLVVLGYPDFGTAGDVIPKILEFAPTACEGLDHRICDVVRSRRGPDAVPPLPGGAAWLMVEIAGDDLDDVRDRTRRLIAVAEAVDSRIVEDTAEAAPLWKIREDGAGLAGRAPSGLPAHAGWEDAAVPPARIGAYLRDFDALTARHGLSVMPYGHLGDGCVHVRLDFPLDKPDGPARFRAFLEDAADLVVSYGGSLSGEHGDGRARSELLARMYSPDAMNLFRRIKHTFDPGNLLNPGNLVDPDPVDANIRVSQARPVRTELALAYHSDGGDFNQAVHRCTGVGKCRADTTVLGGVMCPSYLATKNEKDSTRGRARVLQEMLDGDLVPDWRAEAVHDALDLCLSCKGCASDCPTGIDMAAYKSEVLHQSFKGRVRPRSHYSLGWLPRWSRLASRMPALANLATSLPGIRGLALWIAGVDKRRNIPSFAPKTFRGSFVPVKTGKPVVLFVDSFTDHFSPEIARAAVDLLVDAGYAPQVTSRKACCGLTWISTGQLDAARRILGTTVAELHEAVKQGIPIVGLEPSCTGVLRQDAVELVDNEAAKAVAAATKTVAELLAATPGWEPPSLEGVRVIAQPHCHHHAVMGWGADAKLLKNAGATVKRLGGCCGLAGNFGVERGHYEVSVQVAEQQLLPALEKAEEGDVFLADGFSCRTQADDLAGVTGVHLVQLLADALPKKQVNR
ncbi:FAD/FMN-containing dehydrogenase/Fe-S oxidoreductase [Actinoplanes campanulatus]|uniref:FAD/FMN-containing dehydrogenase/Fe-S oxidoreductase n=1 Tax=Actinoplanes campanulatus TaxID=113559 RepID=A0A7W5FFI9_9ACTN|nr:FAD-binding and (Fe-S)-binding domain-containing protein [Actinoplanes campanulatus]MBB3096402.1 FAD/FMN-containing dehydrogenase/Fe-S oxidoreductase [Actinoplanes campanulatus]GGN18577.1 lactate dehydrogenase [Actinoplanes campanulatus]GID38468.1 lactate dehydrogenase [Actinoplanes campanulatus]